MNRRCLLSGVLAILCAGQTLPATNPTPTTAPARWAAVIDALSSEDFAVRQSGRKDLAKARVKDLEGLRALAAASKDAEVKAQLAQRISELEEEAALNPPGITVDLHNATAQQAAEAIGNEIGLTLAGRPSGMPQTYTLKAVDAPLWDVYLQLSAQAPLALQHTSAGAGLASTSFAISPGVRFGVRSGAFLIYPLSMTYQRAINYQEGGDPAPGSMNFSYAIAIDPRLRLSMVQTPRLLSAVDDQGNELCAPQAQPRVGAPFASALGHSLIRASAPLAVMPGAKKIVSAKGSIAAQVVISEEKLEIADMAKQGNTPITIAGRTVTFGRFQATPANLSVQASVDAAQGAVMLTLTDANGNMIYQTSIAGSFSGSFGGAHPGPIKGAFSVPTRTRDVEVPFELKDLPLP